MDSFVYDQQPDCSFNFYFSLSQSCWKMPSHYGGGVLAKGIYSAKSLERALFGIAFIRFRAALLVYKKLKKNMIHITDETGIAAPEQEIKDVFKTIPENKAWMPGEAFSAEEIRVRLAAAKMEPATPLAEAKKLIEQIKAFQTHGS